MYQSASEWLGVNYWLFYHTQSHSHCIAHLLPPEKHYLALRSIGHNYMFPICLNNLLRSHPFRHVYFTFRRQRVSLVYVLLWKNIASSRARSAAAQKPDHAGEQYNSLAITVDLKTSLIDVAGIPWLRKYIAGIFAVSITCITFVSIVKSLLLASHTVRVLSAFRWITLWFRFILFHLLYVKMHHDKRMNEKCNKSRRTWNG